MQRTVLMSISGFLLILMSTYGNAQQKEIGTLAIRNFEYGNEEKSKGRYHQADSLYTESLKWGRYANTYFNRAMTRKELGNNEGFCTDLAYAAALGDREAWQLHCMNCGTWTAVYKDASGMTLFDSAGYATKMTVHGSPYFRQYFYTTVAADGDTLDDFVVYRSGDTVHSDSKYFQTARFPGGWNKFDKYMKEKLYYPKEAKGREVQGNVTAAYDVAADGSISNARIVNGTDGLDAEMLRFIRVLPRFEPARRNGVPVKSTCLMSIDFGLYETSRYMVQFHER